MNPWLALALCVGGWLLLTIVATVVGRQFERRQHPLAGTARALRTLLLPLALILCVAKFVFRLDEANPDSTTLKLVETFLWIAAIGVALSTVTNTALTRQKGGHYQTRIPKLLIDILRVILVLVGACFVIKAVWGGDLGGMLSVVGVSSIVLGLALQNTLDNVMAGIAVLTERPFEVGDWIQVGGTTGQVLEMNWRSVRVRTRTRDMVVLPNSVIGKETLVNFSRPSKVHGEVHTIGFAYEDAPNKVKRVLQQAALTTRGVLADPAPAVRTANYAAYSIEYRVRFFLDDYDRLQEINDEFMTKVWYAARRNGLAIPYPIQTSYEYRMKLPPPPPRTMPTPLEALQKIPVFVPLGPEDLEAMSQHATHEDYGRGERVVHQGDPGEAMYVILAGTAVVSLRDEQGTEREVARLARGEFFGEMALLTGESRNANVTAVDDLAVLVIHKAALQDMLERRPALAQEMAEIVEARRQGLRAIQEMRGAPADQRQKIKVGAGEIVLRIRKFFGL